MLQWERLRSSLDRAYYAMFHAAQALLLHRGIVPLPKTHRGVIALFGREIVRRGDMSRESGRMLARAFDMRRTGTYEVEVDLGHDQVASIVAQARSFVEQAGAMLD